MQSCQLLGNAFLLQRLFSAQHEGKVEEEEDEEAEEKEEEDEGTLQVICPKPKFWCCFSIQDRILKF